MERSSRFPRLWRLPIRISLGVAAAERVALKLLMGWLLTLILLNVSTRYAGAPLYWVDEAAVFSVVWMTFVGASLMTRMRMDFAVTMVTEKLGARVAPLVKAVSSALVLGFGLALIAMCWVWMDPIGIARFGFDAKSYGAETFNFLYTERTQTLNWPTWVLQLILPLFAVTFSIHALANLVEDLGLHPAEPLRDVGVSGVDAVT